MRVNFAHTDVKITNCTHFLVSINGENSTFADFALLLLPRWKTPAKSSEVNNRTKRALRESTEAFEHLAITIYIQMNDLLTLSKLTQEGRDDIEIPEINKVRGRSTELYTLRKVRLEKARNEFVFKNCRLANRIDNEKNFMEPRGLKNRILYLMWKFVNKSFNTQNICTWQLCCDCHRCRNLRTIL